VRPRSPAYAATRRRAVALGALISAVGLGPVTPGEARASPEARGAFEVRACALGPPDASARRGSAGEVRRGRRAGAEGTRAAPRSERPLHIPLGGARGGASSEPRACIWPAAPEAVARLLELRRDDPVLSLELWSDRSIYSPAVRPGFNLRASHPVYATLFWIGPRGDLFMAFEGVRIPAQRDVTVDARVVVVPPHGRERWVALATLEPAPMPCGGPQAALIRALDGLAPLPFAIGRWEVESRPTP